MKNGLLLTALLLSFNSFASTFECHWQNEGITEGENFYRPASFVLILQGQKAFIKNDTYFDRTYSPCWIGGFESCRFLFEVPKGPLKIAEQSSKQISLEFESIDVYGTGSLYFDFGKDLAKIGKGERVRTLISGDDGDGTYLEESVFLCERKSE